MSTNLARFSGGPKGFRRILFVGFALTFGLALGLALVEFGVGSYTTYVSSREQMDAGFLIYDPELGWQMASNWKGRHRHYDFDVRYSTNSQGLRGRWPRPTPGQRRYVFVGDSFTFGLGVNDDETFVERLSDSRAVYLNAGVAGYSTDQEYLYLKRHLAEWGADEVMLVVYLANDLLDNTLRYPLQATMGKPLFIADGGHQERNIRLTNVPVPLQPKPPEEQRRTLGTMVLGEEAAQRQASSWRSRWQLARILGLAEAAGSADLVGMPGRLATPTDLFTRLAQNIRQLCEENHVKLSLVLMPGRSYVELPESISAQYQDFVRGAILSRQAELGVPVIDLASALRDERKKGEKNLFHPNEGHLAAKGNQVVADLLRSRLTDR